MRIMMITDPRKSLVWCAAVNVDNNWEASVEDVFPFVKDVFLADVLASILVFISHCGPHDYVLPEASVLLDTCSIMPRDVVTWHQD